MDPKLCVQKKYSIISYAALVAGVICFCIVFITPLRIANIGSLAGDYITFTLTGLGMILSIAGIMKRTEKNMLPIISLILSLSLPIFWCIVVVLLFTGLTDFAP